MKRKSHLIKFILAALILGAIAGIILSMFAPQNIIYKSAAIAKPFGDLFIRLLKMIVMPVIIFTLMSGVASISPKSLGKVGIKIIIFYLVTSAVASVIGIILGNILKPGAGLNLNSIQGIVKELNKPSMINTLLSVVPTNPFHSFSNGDGDLLPTIFFSIFFGISLAFCRDSENERIKEHAEVVYKFLDGCSQIVIKITGWIIYYAPIGVFALIFYVFAINGAQAFGPLLKVTFTIYLGYAIQLFLIYTLINFAAGINPIKFLKKIYESALTAFVTRSSGGTLPISMSAAEDKMGIKRGVYGFTLPLGATINMNGTVIYLGVCAIFIANAVGMTLTLSQQTSIVMTSLLAAVGTAGVPGAGVIMLLMVLSSVGLNTAENINVAAAYGMILGIDSLLDMGRTALNISGDLCGTAVVAKMENEMDMKYWDN